MWLNSYVLSFAYYMLIRQNAVSGSPSNYSVNSVPSFTSPANANKSDDESVTFDTNTQDYPDDVRWRIDGQESDTDYPDDVRRRIDGQKSDTGQGSAECSDIMYSPLGGYEAKEFYVYYDEEYKPLAKMIVCYLSTLKGGYEKIEKWGINMSVLPAGVEVHDICSRNEIVEKASKLHLTVTVTKAAELEDSCNIDALMFHMKKFKNRWLGHIITPRADILVPLNENLTDEVEIVMLMEAVAMAWGPVFFLSDRSRYKSLKLIEKALKSKLVMVPTLVVTMVFLLGVVGVMSFFANRRKIAADQRSLQHKKALLLAEWGDEFYEGETAWNIQEEHPDGEDHKEDQDKECAIEMPELLPTLKETEPTVLKGSGEAILSATETVNVEP
ncbi:unnamed protein product [Cylicocyclus nassatus]|uniref:Uncharacterized protein n=1 Tax=Cylicocyclus nassatus TaxID=53992 RepID=A0AA36DS61_CYLNA|nr:unnamed protein product [Cylicocyclus nassatus]